MSCWVVPEIAADLWGIPLEQVFERIRDGSIQSKCEGGFVFVDVKPQLAASYQATDYQETATAPFRRSRWQSPRDSIASHRRPPRAA